MKKIFSVVLVAAVLFLTGCFKDNTINNGPGSFNTANGGIKGDYIQFTYSGLEYFGNSTLLLAGVTSPVTIPIIVNLASVKPLTQDLNVAIAVNDAARTDYNSTSAVQYVAMPDSDYTISSLAGTIKAGQRLDTFLITFDPNKIDPTQNYMLPITLQAANGVTLSGNLAFK